MEELGSKSSDGDSGSRVGGLGVGFVWRRIRQKGRKSRQRPKAKSRKRSVGNGSRNQEKIGGMGGSRWRGVCIARFGEGDVNDV